MDRRASHEARTPGRCSIVIPARNEAGNIEAAVLRTPGMGLGTEIIFIEGHSKDNPWDEIQRVKANFPERDIQVLKQQGRGKGSAVREAFATATGDLLFILDADLAMPPEELPTFYEAARRTPRNSTASRKVSVPPAVPAPAGRCISRRAACGASRG